MALGADGGAFYRKPAIMADQLTSFLMLRQADVAVAALDGVPAIAAKEKVGDATAVQEDQTLIATGEGLFDCVDELGSKQRRFARDGWHGLQINNFHLGQRSCRHPFWQGQEAVFAGRGVVKTGDRRRC